MCFDRKLRKFEKKSKNCFEKPKKNRFCFFNNDEDLVFNCMTVKESYKHGWKFDMLFGFMLGYSCRL